MSERIAFIGGGNMASAIIGGLIQQGHPASQIDVVEPWAEARQASCSAVLAYRRSPPGTPQLAHRRLVVWAVKPQTFKDAAIAQAQPFSAPGALHLSVAAGIRSDSMATWLGSERIVRAMPNTPALVGKGIAGCTPALPCQRQTGSASKPSWPPPASTCGWSRGAIGRGHRAVGLRPGLRVLFHGSHDHRRHRNGPEPRSRRTSWPWPPLLAPANWPAALHEPPEVLRQRVTSKGGTTYAAMHRDGKQ
jgi:pyrroline-5-carboxylate reductase